MLTINQWVTPADLLILSIQFFLKLIALTVNDNLIDLNRVTCWAQGSVNNFGGHDQTLLFSR
jgi:hypothetical protein